MVCIGIGLIFILLVWMGAGKRKPRPLRGVCAVCGNELHQTWHVWINGKQKLNVCSYCNSTLERKKSQAAFQRQSRQPSRQPQFERINMPDDNVGFSYEPGSSGASSSTKRATQRSTKRGSLTKVILAVFVLFVIGSIWAVIDPPPKNQPSNAENLPPTLPTMATPPPATPPAAEAQKQEDEVPLTEDQKARIITYKAAAAELIKTHEIAQVDYEKGRMWMDPVAWDNDTKGYKESVLQGLYVASFGNAKHKKATIYSSNGYEELGHYVGIEGPTILK